MNNHGIWIWENRNPQYDEYADFSAVFFVRADQKAVSLRISSDSNYAAYINGKLAAFGQYADLPHCKVADTHDIAKYCKDGENEILITVWYHGAPSSTYQTGKAGLFFEITAGECVAAASGYHTLCRKNPFYAPHREKMITKEQGFSFFYNAAAPETCWHESIATGYEPELHERPILPLVLENLANGEIVGGNGITDFILDLGREEVGFLELFLESDREQTVTIAYGEHLVNGKVPRLIGKRDFSVEYGTVTGSNSYMNPFRRLGCRYLEVTSEVPIKLIYAGLRPTMYPVEELPFDAGSPRRQKIYEVAKRTLRLCMHEHYEDCPWREQALYAMDSRNQMLSGYYAFGETRFARASLWLLGQDRREDGFLSDCVPSGIGLVIPSFCLHWYQEVLEYTDFSGDLTLAEEIWDKLCSVLDAFMGYYDEGTGLIPCLPTDRYWNFYEWSGRYLMGNFQEPGKPDMLLNCLFLRALDTMTELSRRTGLPFRLSHMVAPLRQSIRRTFRREDGLYNTDVAGTHICELGNALAVLTGVADAEDANTICRMLTNTKDSDRIRKIPIDLAVLSRVCDRTDPNGDTVDIVPASLSMSCFVYDALLQTDFDQYREYVLDEIDRQYGIMLDAGADTFWETLGGWHTFENAGSLCHGWNGMPIYYYHKLLK